MAATAKVSLTMERHALRLAKAVAERTGASLSSLVSAALERHLGEVIAELQRRRAADEIIATFPAEHLPTLDEQRSLVALWSKSGPRPSETEIEALLRGSSRDGRKRARARRSRAKR